MAEHTSPRPVLKRVNTPCFPSLESSIKDRVTMETVQVSTNEAPHASGQNPDAVAQLASMMKVPSGVT